MEQVARQTSGPAMEPVPAQSARTDLRASGETAPAAVPAKPGSFYCNWGVFALLVGIFAFGIPCGIWAIHLGKRGAENGAPTFGSVIHVLGWIEIIAAAFGLLLLLGGTH